MPPTKPYNEYKVGEVVQHNYKFFGDAFDPNNQQFRDWFFANATTEADVRAKLLNGYKLDIPVGIKLVVVDLEYARMRSWNLNPKTEEFYEFIIPPVPRRSNTDDYVESQQWEEAWFHAIVDGYGM